MSVTSAWTCRGCWTVNRARNRRCTTCDLEKPTGERMLAGLHEPEEAKAEPAIPTVLAVAVLIAGGIIMLHAAVALVAGGIYVAGRIFTTLGDRDINGAAITALVGGVGLGLTWLEFLLGRKIVQGSRSAWLLTLALAAMSLIGYFVAETRLQQLIAELEVDPAALASLPWRWIVVAPFAYITIALLLALLVDRLVLMASALRRDRRERRWPQAG